MSYILEALKKSEQERHRGRAPDLQALHTAAPAQTSLPRRWWPLALLLALLLNVSLLLIWRPWETARPEAAAVPATITAAPTPPRPAITPPALQVQAPPQVAPVVPAIATPAATKASALAAPTQPQENQILALSDLPPDVRRSIPEMSFAVHLYSVKPAERMVSINGKMLKEGQEVTAGLKLEQITSDGMIFSYQGYHFKRGVF